MSAKNILNFFKIKTYANTAYVNYCTASIHLQHRLAVLEVVVNSEENIHRENMAAQSGFPIKGRRYEKSRTGCQ